MSLWEALPIILLGFLVVLLPIGVIGLFASKLAPHERTAFLILYAGAVFLLGVVTADVTQIVPNRLAVDVALLVGGLAVGVFGGVLLPFRWPFDRLRKTRHR